MGDASVLANALFERTGALMLRTEPVPVSALSGFDHLSKAQVWHLGELIPLAKLVGHYRLMARAFPNNAGFYRQRLRVAIREYREQVQERIAA